MPQATPPCRGCFANDVRGRSPFDLTNRNDPFRYGGLDVGPRSSPPPSSFYRTAYVFFNESMVC